MLKKWREGIKASILDYLLVRNPPQTGFQAWRYQQINSRRLEHLASLNLDLHHKTVLELGAGIGDHTSFFLDRNCKVTCVEGRQSNLSILSRRYPEVQTLCVDLDRPFCQETEDLPKFDVVCCYGLLYHLFNPQEAIRFMADRCAGMVLLQTCVSQGDEVTINRVDENGGAATQSLCGRGCRPTRPWIFGELKSYFDYVYLPTIQPNHIQFPCDWTVRLSKGQLVRSMFVASRKPIDNPLLADELIMQQIKSH